MHLEVCEHGMDVMDSFCHDVPYSKNYPAYLTCPTIGHLIPSRPSLSHDMAHLLLRTTLTVSIHRKLRPRGKRPLTPCSSLPWPAIRQSRTSTTDLSDLTCALGIRDESLLRILDALLPCAVCGG